MKSILIFFLSFQILNLSVNINDYALTSKNDFTAGTAAESNHIDSFAEYFSEIILNRVNSFHEMRCESHKEPRHHSPINYSIKLFVDKALANILSPFYTVQRKAFFFEQNYLYSFAKKIVPPPPKF